ncbi:MAG: hypothetical protein IJW79_10130 [Clostridia bacterium]|nr:hypothetical protein [Clostridia bacterium]
MSNSRDNENNSERLMRLIGLAARAGKLVYGTPMVCEALRRKQPIYYVFRAEGVSANTKKRMDDKCEFYNVRLVDLELDMSEFAHRLGKSGELAVAALTDEDFAKGIEKLI